MPEPKNISEQVAALRRELKLTWDAHEREHIQHEAAHGREHQFAQTAIDTAAKLSQENKTDANEWRASMNDREAKFSTKDDVKAILARLDSIERAGLVSDERLRKDKEAAAERERTEKEAASARNTRSMWMVGIMATIGAVLVNAVLRLSGN